MKEKIESAFLAFNNLNVLVVGDIMLDEYIWGNVDRISPEAPVPIVSVGKRENRLGGAGNVILNFKALGVTPIICATIGKDKAGDTVLSEMEANHLPVSGIIKCDNRSTTCKTRIMGNKQQMLRIDNETLALLNTETEKQLIATIDKHLDNNTIDAIVFEDYNKGLLTKKVIEHTISKAKEKNIPTVCDPKKANFLAYKGITLFKPNLKELNEGLNKNVSANEPTKLNNAVKELIEKLNLEKALITLSENGVLIATKHSVNTYPAHVRSISDVSGAGDTVLSVATACLAAGLNDYLIANIANLSGGLVCEHIGVVPIDKARLLKESLLLPTE